MAAIDKERKQFETSLQEVGFLCCSYAFTLHAHYMYTIHTYIHIHCIPRPKYKPVAEIIPAHESSRTTIIYIYIYIYRERERERENSISIVLSFKKWLRCTFFVTEIRLSDPKITSSSGIKSAPGAHACSSCCHLHRPLSRAAI